MSSTKQKWLIFIFPLLLAAPFLNRAYFVDDSYFVEIATWLKDHPLQPYHFRADDAGPQNRGIEENGFVRMVNPLAHQYYLALLLKIGGEREWFLRLGCVLLSCFSALFIFGLARRLSPHPFWATLLTVTTPVFWLTSYSLLIDATMGFFFFGALFFFFKGVDSGLWRWFCASGIFMGLCILSKYPGVFVIPLSAVFFMLEPMAWQRRCQMVLKAGFAWVIAGLCLLGYSVWTYELYGVAHILGASARMLSTYGWPKYMVFFVFLSGATLLPLVVWANVGRWGLVGGIVGIVAGGAFFASPWGGFSVLQGFLLSLWLVTSCLFFVTPWQWRHHVRRPEIAVLLWIFGFCAMMFLVMGWVAARYYVIVVPALVFWLIRFMNEAWIKRSFVMLVAATSCLAYADYRQAEAARDIGSKLQSEGYAGGPHHYYLGDSFTFSYFKRYGWTPCFPQTSLMPGDFVFSKEVSMPQVWFFQKSVPKKLIGEWVYSSRFPIRVMDNRGSAGFYASVWGALPFTISSSPWERFRLYEIGGFTNIPAKNDRD